MEGKLRLLRVHWLLWVLLIGFTAWTWWSYDAGGIIHKLVFFDEQAVLSLLDSTGIVTSVLIFVLLAIIEVIIAPLHPSVLYITSGILFGGFWGGVFLLIGVVIGSVIAFYIGRAIGRPLLDYVDNTHIHELNRLSEHYGGITLFLLRINPLTNFDMLSYIAGVSRISLGKFVLATTLSQAPYVFLASYFASEIAQTSPGLALFVIWIGIIVMIALSYIAFYKYIQVRRRVKLKRGRNHSK